MAMTKTDIPLADATTAGGKEDPSPVPGVGVDKCADADTEEAVAAAPVGVTFEVEGDEEEGDDKLGNEDTNPRQFVTWESRGASYQFANNPMRTCVWIILVLRAVHMGLVFGTTFINPGFLTGESEMYDLLTDEFHLLHYSDSVLSYIASSFMYTGTFNPDWNPGFSSKKANTFITGSQGFRDAMSFLVAFVADFLIGDYWTILILLIVLFLPGTLIFTLCAWPYLLGDAFPIKLYRVGFQILFGVGASGIDTIADIFGAKQFHPIIHTRLLDSYLYGRRSWLALEGQLQCSCMQ